VGRTKVGVAVFGALTALSLASAAHAGQPISIGIGGGPDKPKRLTGVLTATGPVSPGNTIRVSARRMPKRASGALFYGGVLGTPRCEEPLTLCTLDLLPTSQEWETSGRGKVAVRFAMPSHFTVFVRSSGQGRYETREISNGQAIKIVMLVARVNRQRQLVTGTAAVKTAVGVPVD
jgi:hypothetical protein